MKLACATIASLLIINTVSGQTDFKVIKVNGSIILKERGISLETGIVFNENENLLFRSEDATAAVINPQKGRLVITSREHNLSAAKSNSMPAMYNITTRGNSRLGSEELKLHFSGKYLLLGRDFVLVETTSFPMNNQSFFFLRYNYKGEVINKKLAYNGDSLFIDRENLLTIDGKTIPGADNPSIKLYYRKGKESVLINEFELYFADENQLEKEIGIIIESLKGKTEAEILSEAGIYVGEFYGKVNPVSFSTWLKKHFALHN